MSVSTPKMSLLAIISTVSLFYRKYIKCIVHTSTLLLYAISSSKYFKMKNLIKNKSILIICICVFIFTGTAQGQENGGFFEIDCFHVDPALSSEGTKDKITVKFWSNSTLLGEQRGSIGAPLGIGGLNLITLVINGIRLLGDKEGCDCSIFHIACYPSPKNNLHNLTHISVETNGTDALFIDEAAFKAYQTVTASGLAVNTPIPGKTIKWGKESGNGWCLSKESNDVNEFSNYVIDGSCHQAITFLTSN